MDSYVMQARKAVEMPRSFLILGSNDRVTWNILSVQQNVSWTDNTAQTFRLNVVANDSYYRLVMIQMNPANDGYMSLYQFYPMYNNINPIQKNAVTFTSNQWLTATNAVLVTITVSYPTVSPSSGTCSTLASLAMETASFVQNNVYCLFPLSLSAYTSYTNYTATYGTSTPFYTNVSGTPFTPAPFAPPYVPVVTPTPTPTPVVYPDYIPPALIPWSNGTITKIWTAVATSSSGQYITASVYNSILYTSSDYGVTFVSVAVTASNWSSIAISYSGQYQTAVVFNGPVWYSSNFGATWTTSTAASQSWSSVAMSASGQYQVGLVYNGQTSVTNATTLVVTNVINGIWYSSNYGMSWSVSTFPTALTVLQDWSSIAMSKTGQYATAVSNNGYIYTSSNQGQTWSLSSSGVATKMTWTSVGMSFDGSIQAATVSTGNVYISTNFGASWTVCTYPPFTRGTILTQVCQSIALSYSGTTMTCVVSNVGTYVSNDTGNTWQQDNTNSYAWVSGAISGDGLFKVAVIANGPISTWNNGPGAASPLFSWRSGSTALFPPNAVVLSTTTAAEAKTTTTLDRVVFPTKTWNSVVSSSTGQYQLAGSQTGLYVSSMYGIGWTCVSTTGNWYGVALSNSGQVMIAAAMNGGISYSSNYGVTWTNSNMRTNAWTGVAVSGTTGQYASAIINNGGIYYSSDYGHTWTASNAPTAQWNSIAMSADGTVQVATINGGYIYVTSNSSTANNVTTRYDLGSNWLLSGSAALAWTSVCMDTTGQYMTATVNNAGMYYSTTKGVTWFANNAPSKAWKSVTCTYDGATQYACVYNGPLYLSTDRGMNWITATAPVALWSSVAVSGDGTHVSAANSVSTIATFRQSSLAFDYLYGEWVQIKLANATPITAYHLVPKNPLTMCISYVILGSVNGYQWTYLSFQSNPLWIANTPNLFYLNTNDAYTYIRLVVVQMNPSAPSFELSGFCLYGPTGPLFPLSSAYTVSPYATNILLKNPGNMIQATISASWSLARNEDATQKTAYMMTADGYSAAYLGVNLSSNSTYASTGMVNPSLAPASSFQYATPLPTSTNWNVNGEWIQVQLAIPTLLSGYKLVPKTGLVANMPSAFVLLGSMDGAAWTYVSSATNLLYWVEGIPQTFPVVNAQMPYIYYRLVFTQGPADIDIGGWILLNASGDPVYSSEMTQLVPQTTSLTFSYLQLWVDASLLTLVDGAVLPNWRTPANTPLYNVSSTGTYKANFINGKGVIQLLPGQTITVPSISVGATLSVFSVFYPNNQLTEGASVQLGAADTSPGFYLQTASPQFCVNTGTSPVYTQTSTSILASNTVQVVAGISSATGTNVYANGYVVASSVSSAMTTPTPTPMAQTLTVNGMKPTVSSNYVAELMVFNVALSDTQRQFVEGYLAWKWGFSNLLPPTHPYYIYAPQSL